MNEPHYDRLSQLDNSFLIYEDGSPAAAMHVASTQVHEARPLQTADGSLDIGRIEEYVLSRLHDIPRYRQRIHRTPIEGHPVWVDDASFNIHYHVRHTRLPRPGTERQLKRLVGRIFSQRLDRHKPLWELWVIEGLEGNRLAFLSKVHHCMVDGVSGSELLAALLSPTPLEKPEPAPQWRPRPIPNNLALGAGEISRVVGAPISLAQAVGRVVTNEDDTRHQLSERMRAVRRVLGDAGGTTPVVFNRPIGPHRRIDWMKLPIDEIKQIGRSLDATLNDVVLATVAGAFGRFLSRHRGMDLDDLRFRVLAPVSVRREDQRGSLGNQVSAWTVDLPIAERDPLERVKIIREETTELKESHAALGAESIGKVTEWTGAGLLSLTARLATAGTPFNTVVTNVPGPQVPLYLLESRLLEIHPHVPLMGNMGIGIALFSYDGDISWGLSADWDLVPDLHELAEGIEAAFEELRAAAA